MNSRVGIELARGACRIVEVEGDPVQRGGPVDTRVRAFAVLPTAGRDTAAHLESLKGRSAAVVVWGGRSDHRQVVVSEASYEKMRAEALAAVQSAGIDTHGMLADIARVAAAPPVASRQPVMLALADGGEVSALLQPLRDAGLRIRAVMTPAHALLGLARARRASATPGGLEAYVALDDSAICVALVRDGALVGARELSWGFRTGLAAAGPGPAAEVSGRQEALAQRLGDALIEIVESADGPLAQVAICGGLPDLRTMTVPLMERLDIEVEPLDSLFAIDADHLPAPADQFREQAAALRLAWAAAADWRNPFNLLRYRERQARRATLARAAVVAGIATGLGAGWGIQQSAWWAGAEEAGLAARTPVRVPSAPRAIAASRQPELPRASEIPANAAPLPLAAPVAGPAVAAPPEAPGPAARPFPPTPQAPAAVPPPASREAGIAPPLPVTRPAAVPRPAPPPAASERQRAAVPAPPPRAPVPLPFDAVLGSILYSPDRKLAIVNGGIVTIGDVVNGAQIVDITPTAVLLRDAQNRLRSLSLGSPPRPPAAR